VPAQLRVLSRLLGLLRRRLLRVLSGLLSRLRACPAPAVAVGGQATPTIGPPVTLIFTSTPAPQILCGGFLCLTGLLEPSNGANTSFVINAEDEVVIVAASVTQQWYFDAMFSLRRMND